MARSLSAKIFVECMNQMTQPSDISKKKRKYED